MPRLFDSGDPSELFNQLLKDPKALLALQKSTQLAEFKEQYKAVRASPLKCPACSQWGQTGGSLWITEDKKTFVCRKCRLVWELECKTVNTEELIFKMRQAAKGET